MDTLIEALEARAESADVARKPCWTEQRLQEFERQHGVELPATYRQLLICFGPFDDEYGLCITEPTLYDAAKTGAVRPCLVTMSELAAFGQDLRSKAQSHIAAGGRLFSPAHSISTVLDKQICTSELLRRFEEIDIRTGFASVGYSVGGDLYLCVSGELTGTVWSDAEYGLIPEILVSEDDVQPYGFDEWLQLYLREVN